MASIFHQVSLLYTHLFYRDDFKTASFRIQPLFAYKEPALADPKVFQEKLEECSRQAKEGKAQAVWYSYYAQKPE